MKTANPNINYFTDKKSAERFFDKQISADFLQAIRSKDYYIDKSKDAIKQWPNLYTLIKTK